MDYMDRFCRLVVRVPSYRSRGPSSILQRYQIFWEVVGLERGLLSLVSTIEELRERDYGCRDPSHWPRGTLYPQKLPLTSPTSGGRSVCIVRSRIKATEFCSVLDAHLISSFAGRGAVAQRLARVGRREAGVWVPVGSRIFTSPYHPYGLWGPPILLSHGYRGLFRRR
jgi:hypothetical protein